jgi:hypothetical protein
MSSFAAAVLGLALGEGLASGEADAAVEGLAEGAGVGLAAAEGAVDGVAPEPVEVPSIVTVPLSSTWMFTVAGVVCVPSDTIAVTVARPASSWLFTSTARQLTARPLVDESVPFVALHVTWRGWPSGSVATSWKVTG